ncbi:MAG: hypothetical protein AAFZ74_17765 [Pseudomonadota bacterium]
MKRATSLIALGAAMTLFAACGGGGGESVTPSSSTSASSTPATPPVSPPPPPPPPAPSTPVSTSIDGAVSKATSGGLPGGLRNAAERKSFAHYVGTTKDLTGRHPKQLPIRAYFAACETDTDTPRMFVSMTLEDPSQTEDPDIPTIGSIFETIYDPATKSLRRTGNETRIDLCQETHGITVSSDCSRVAVLCNTDFEDPVSESEYFTRDLVEESGISTFNQPNNKTQVDNNSNIAPENRSNRYLYNGEMWLLEWDGVSLSSQPDRYVIHKAVGGAQAGAASLVYAEEQDAYGAAFITNSFDNNGGRHKSGALVVVERDGWVLNGRHPLDRDESRGFNWDCANGHVMHMRAFFNPFNGIFAALCTSDFNRYWLGNGGAIGIKNEYQDIFGGYEGYLVASSSGGVTNGGAHKAIPIDDKHSIVVLAAAPVIPLDNPDFVAFIQEAEAAAIDRGTPERGFDACAWYWELQCEAAFMEDYYYNNGRKRYPAFRGNFWNGSEVLPTDLTRIGLLKVSDMGRANIDGDYQNVKWIVEDEDCILGAPQITDMKNGRFLLGWAKFQCISDGHKLQRFAGKHTLHPKAYYLMEIDAEGNALTEPFEMTSTGWGGQDEMVYLGGGRVGWAYIPNPTLDGDGNYSTPYQSDWEFMVYESPN